MLNPGSNRAGQNRCTVICKSVVEIFTTDFLVPQNVECYLHDYILHSIGSQVDQIAFRFIEAGHLNYQLIM